MSDHTDRDDDQVELTDQDTPTGTADTDTERAPGIASVMDRLRSGSDRERSAFKRGRMGG